MDITPTELETYANSFGQGYLKYHKAVGILQQISAAPEILDGEVRFLAFLKNCLQMEGFRDLDIELIMGWIYERKDQL